MKSLKEAGKNKEQFMNNFEKRLMKNMGMKGFSNKKKMANAENEGDRNRVITEMFLNKITIDNDQETK